MLFDFADTVTAAALLDMDAIKGTDGLELQLDLQQSVLEVSYVNDTEASTTLCIEEEEEGFRIRATTIHFPLPSRCTCMYV